MIQTIIGLFNSIMNSFQYKTARRNGLENKQIYELCDNIRRLVKNSKKRTNIKDFPSVAAGCYTNRNLYIDTTDSRPNYSQVPILEHELQQIGPIGSKRNQCKYTIGACAEPKVAFFAMIDGWNNLRTLKFTFSYRPRTGTKKKYCRNCRDVFNI